MADAVLITEITDDNREALIHLAVSMYLGEACKFCGKVYDTHDDLKDTVFAGYHERGRLACTACWQQYDKAE